VIRVLLVDDHPVVRDGLRGMFADEPGVEVVGEAGDGLAAVAAAQRLRPDVVLMDLRMPRQDGVTATRELRRVVPDVQVLVLTTFDTDGDIERAIAAGAVGYLLKDAPRADLMRGVRAAARGEAALSPTVAARLMARSVTPAPEPLTARERQVLTLVADGLTNRQIGRRLRISETTVKTHLVRSFAKLGVDDRTAAVTAALQRGLLDLGGQRLPAGSEHDAEHAPLRRPGARVASAPTEPPGLIRQCLGHEATCKHGRPAHSVRVDVGQGDVRDSHGYCVVTTPR